MRKILIIDDDTFICELLKKHLENNGYEVNVAYQGKTAIGQFKTVDYDAVLCDFRLPDTSGLDMLQKLRALKNNIPVVIMTAYADVRMAVRLMKLGASDYITKPIQREELLALLKQLFVPEGREKTHQKTTTSEIPSAFTDGDFIIGESPQIKKVINLARRVAPTNMSVIIEGETGTGKEYIARFIHENSLRRGKPFVAIDCGAIPKDLANSELFGHVKGSFTGAVNDKNGVFQKADGGTLFLDEVGNLTYDVQLKLLRAIQERVISRLGEDKARKIDIRIIAATNEDLKHEIRDSNFREDLYHRLNEFNIVLPPLRERSEDILIFVRHFIEKANSDLNREVKDLSDEARKIILDYPWHGNLRELKNVIKRAVLMAEGDRIEKTCFPVEICFPEIGNDDVAGELDLGKDVSMLKNASSEVEKQLIIRTIQDAGYNKSKAARILNIDRKTLYNKIKLYNIEL